MFHGLVSMPKIKDTQKKLGHNRIQPRAERSTFEDGDTNTQPGAISY